MTPCPVIEFLFKVSNKGIGFLDRFFIEWFLYDRSTDRHWARNIFIFRENRIFKERKETPDDGLIMIMESA